MINAASEHTSTAPNASSVVTPQPPARPSNDLSGAGAPPRIPQKKSPSSLKLILGGILLLLLVITSGVGLYLSQQNQDIRQQAAGGCKGNC